MLGHSQPRPVECVSRALQAMPAQAASAQSVRQDSSQTVSPLHAMTVLPATQEPAASVPRAPMVQSQTRCSPRVKHALRAKQGEVDLAVRAHQAPKRLQIGRNAKRVWHCRTATTCSARTELHAWRAVLVRRWTRITQAASFAATACTRRMVPSVFRVSQARIRTTQQVGVTRRRQVQTGATRAC